MTVCSVRRAVRAIACAALAAGSIARTSAAEPPAATQPAPEPDIGSITSDLVPPSLASASDVTYPEGARGDALVVLMLTVGREGQVETVRAIEGEEPFASAATAAASAWRFEPARRRGQPVAARIRF